MTTVEVICIVFGLGISYLIGSISPSIWIGRIFYGVDVRTKGSCNAGSTNTIRVLGLKAGIIVFIIDVFIEYIFHINIHIHTFIYRLVILL